MALNARQQAFVAEYCVDLNATQAAIRAGYSERTAYSQGQRLLKHVEVAAAIREAQEKREERTQVSQDQVVFELARIAFGDVRALFDEEGRLRRPHELTAEVAAAISSIEVVTVSRGEGEVEHVAKVRAWNKLKALELLGKHLGMFGPKGTEDDPFHTVSRTIEIVNTVQRPGRDE